MKKRYYIFILIFIVLKIYSQSNIKVPEFTDPSPGDEVVATPDVMAFQKYSFIPVNLYTGRVNVEVPLYNITLGNISVPVSITYNTGGIKVVDEASNVGLGWNLNAGGNILKIVKDVDDRKYSMFSYQVADDYEPNQGTLEWKVTIKGYHQKFNDLYDENYIDYDKIDSSPDFYLVNAPGIQTKFFLKDANLSDVTTHFKDRIYEPVFINKTGVTMNNVQRTEISLPYIGFNANEDGNPSQNFAASPIFQTAVTYVSPLNPNGISTVYGGNPQNDGWYYKYDFDSFSLKNPQGLIYFFDKKNIVETYSLPALDAFSFVNNYDIYVSSWGLSSITDPSTNNNVQFEYETYQRTEIINIPNFTSRPSNVSTNACFFDYMNYNQEDQEIYSSVTAVKYPKIERIKRIIWNNGKIEFEYNLDRDDAIGEKALTKIEVKDLNDNIIKAYTFEYSYFNSKEGCSEPECKRLKLNKIYEIGRNGESKLLREFEYYYDNPLPKRTSLEKDYLGYYNNNGYQYNFNGDYLQLPPKPTLYFHENLGRNTILPFPLANHTYDEITGDYSLLPNMYSLSALLKKIKLPTGGSVEFEYENPTFNFLGEEYAAGGARIKKQIIKDAGNQIREVKYIYENQNNLTTGYVNNIPVFGYPSNELHDELTIFDKSRGGLELTDNSFVGYAEVTELEIGNGKTVYEYTSPMQYSNIYETRSTTFSCGNYLLQNSSYPNLNYLDRDLLRGKLIQKAVFDNNDNLLIKSTYTYNHQIFNTYNLDYKVKIYYEQPPTSIGERMFFEINATSAINIERNLLIKETTKEYFGNSEKTTITEYVYDANYPFIKETKLTDDVSELKSEYFYPFDSEVSNEPYMNELVVQNRIVEPVIQKTYKDGNLVSISKYNYKDYGVLWGSSLIGKKSLETGKDENMLSHNSEIIMKDTKGNVTLYKDNAETFHHLIWGYGKTKIIAKIDNLSASQINTNISSLISAAVDASDNDVDSNTEDALRVALNNLRIALPENAQMTSYTYDPLIGVTSITDVKGDTLYYVYDDFNRLWLIKDGDGNILKEYEYHYKE